MRNPNSSPSSLGEGDRREAMVEGLPRYAAVARRAPPPRRYAARSPSPRQARGGTKS